MDHSIEILGTVIFALAVLHTFCVKQILQWAHHFPPDSGRRAFLHLAGEIEVVFGLWAAIFMFIYGVMHGFDAVVEYQKNLEFTEPIFIFCIMVVSATKPVLFIARSIIQFFAKIMTKIFRVSETHADVLGVLILGPLSGSFITEPAAMTVSALLLNSMVKENRQRLMYLLLAILFVNVSIGGALTPFAAPPMLMVAHKWNWDFAFVMKHFGWKSISAVTLNTLLLVVFFAKDIRESMQGLSHFSKTSLRIPLWVLAVHALTLLGLVASSHHTNTAFGIFLLFLGVSTVTKKYQEPLRLRESLLVAFFLGGIIMFGPLQKWWLQSLLSQMSQLSLYFGASALTAITDNAALTYLGSQVEGLSEVSKYYLVAGALAGGGLTIIANAPNAAGFSILQNRFPRGLSPLLLLLAALIPTVIAIVCLGSVPEF
jgi:Na+/H+ antiporter NhaD/arsenite permease-like protein